MHYVRLKRKAPKSLGIKPHNIYAAYLIGSDKLDTVLTKDMEEELKKYIEEMRVNLSGYYLLRGCFDDSSDNCKRGSWLILSYKDFIRYFRQA